MLRATRRRIGAPAWLALGLVIGLPAMAEAQLFPNREIRRERPQCAGEPPFNAHVRRDYFGYYPTCWSRFPEGWACPCPNPELPNSAAAFRDRPRDPAPKLTAPVDENADTGEAPMGRDPLPGDTNLPPVPNPGRSPFDIERPDGGTPPDPSLPPRGPAGPRPGARPGDNSSSATPATRPGSTTGLLEMPAMPAPTALAGPTADPGGLMLAPEATLTSNTTPTGRDLGPLPAAPMPATSAPIDAGLPVVAGPAPAPAPAPQRRGLLGGLFGQGNRRRR